MLKNKKIFFKLIGLFIITYILVKIDLKNVIEVLKNSNPIPIIIALVLNVPQLWLKSTRWQYLLKIQDIRISNAKSFAIYMRSLFLGIITPGRLGEMSKAYILKQENKATFSKAFSSVLLDRSLDLGLLFSISAFSFLILRPFPYSHLLSFSILLALIIAFILFVLSGKYEKRIVLTTVKLLKIKDEGVINKNTIVEFFHGLGKLVSWKIVLSFLYTALSYSIFFYQCLLIFHSTGIFESYGYIVMVMAIVNVISFLPISFSGIGTREAALLFLLNSKGYSQEMIISSSILILFVFYIGGLVLGSVFWFKYSER